MEFALSEDQRMLQDSLKGVLNDAASLDRIRKIAVGDAGESAVLDGALTEFGLAALMVPEAAGGLGLGALDACLVQEALGYNVAPSRFLATAVAAQALAGHADVLGAIAAGEAKFALALTEVSSRRDGAGVELKGGKLSGKSLLAQSVDGATHILVADTAGAWHSVSAADAGVTGMQTIDRTRTFHEVTLDGARPLVSVTPGVEVLALARLLVAADTLGAAQAMIDKAVAYAKERQQFGRVIGSFQAVKHMCAEMAAKLEPARALIWHAAHALDIADEEGPMMANLAKAHLAEVGTFVARTSTEVHGGMGFTDLVGLHYWYKRIGVNRQLLGSPEQARQTAAELQGLVA
ncbi:acyl-CoA dehydrogenase family protein [Hyphomonas polymorpha PS728]|uniref:Acyl-CoA dehydrogenase family protein n=1 Tax=Hyphomonas polymorpha PS728 TaxID=1280954 RepID=A0A062VFN7_9PROT|nr:acyl-CoA dehydrogenase family protein [Hyphomonas polymorpha]KCZ97295.1 acyl-CoA dehydrogenase family protein [Hyphomonas polymorpha PS728]